MVSQGVRVQKFIDASGLSRYLSSSAKLISKALAGAFAAQIRDKNGQGHIAAMELRNAYPAAFVVKGSGSMPVARLVFSDSHLNGACAGRLV